MANVAEYLVTLTSPMQRARAKAALETQVRVNGAEFMTRHELMERRISSGSKVVDQHGDMVLLNADGSFLNQRGATKYGLNYAAWLSVQS